MNPPNVDTLWQLSATLSLVIAMLIPLLAGLIMGAFFYAGLWWTVIRGTRSSRAVLWFFSSLMLRMSLVLAGIYTVADGQWQRLAACLAGFICARIIVLKLSQHWQPLARVLYPGGPDQESRHAS